MFNMDLNLASGEKVIYKGNVYLIKAPFSIDQVILEDLSKTITVMVKIDELRPCPNSCEQKNNRDLSEISQEDWDIAKKREIVLMPLLQKSVCTIDNAKKAGIGLGLTYRQIYNLISIYRKSGCKLISLVPNKFKGGKGKNRILSELEPIIFETINEIYLTKQRVKISKLVEEIQLRCHRLNLKPPAERTIRRRLATFGIEKEIISRREGSKVARDQYSPIKGSFPEVQFPLGVYQIDHTKVDLIVVDEVYRQPIGRPYITVAIDIYSRCIPGFCLTLELPSSTSVGLCLTHAVFDKAAWLAERKIEAEWPILGKPEGIYVDNATEFHSDALIRGCEAHGIKIEYRPIGRAHYGGIIERLIGTLMQLVHQVPGTTFSNVQDRGKYDSEKTAILTLAELERWFAIAITQYYHNKIHTVLLQSPIERYKRGILGDNLQKGRGYPPRIYNQKSFLIDFLPIEYRTIQRHGFMLNNIVYYSNSLSPFIANRSRHGKFLIRHNPKDLSIIYVLDPKSQQYIEVPYRTLSRPSVSLGEYRQAMKYLRDKGIANKDENTIFQAIEGMREITKKACAKSKVARRQYEKYATLTKPREKAIIEDKDDDNEPIKPYEVELW
jgi:putative transposase